MARKKRATTTGGPGGKYTLRFDSAELSAAAAKYAKDRRTSVNAVILNLLEAMLRKRGYLPPRQPPAAGQ